MAIVKQTVIQKHGNSSVCKLHIY